MSAGAGRVIGRAAKQFGSKAVRGVEAAARSGAKPGMRTVQEIVAGLKNKPLPAFATSAVAPAERVASRIAPKAKPIVQGVSRASQVKPVVSQVSPIVAPKVAEPALSSRFKQLQQAGKIDPIVASNLTKGSSIQKKAFDSVFYSAYELIKIAEGVDKKRKRTAKPSLMQKYRAPIELIDDIALYLAKRGAAGEAIEGVTPDTEEPSFWEKYKIPMIAGGAALGGAGLGYGVPKFYQAMKNVPPMVAPAVAPVAAAVQSAPPAMQGAGLQGLLGLALGGMGGGGGANPLGAISELLGPEGIQELMREGASKLRDIDPAQAKEQLMGSLKGIEKLIGPAAQAFSA